MIKNLPNVYVVPIDKEIKNNKEIFKSSNELAEIIPININDIKHIFKEKDHVYKSKVIINNKKTVDIIGLTNQHLLTLTGEKIPINQINSIKKV